MRILYIANSTNLSGGDTKSLQTLLAGMRAKGVDCHVVVPDRGGLYDWLKSEGISVVVVNYRMDIYPQFRTVKDKLLFVPRLLCRRYIEWNAVRTLVRLCGQWNADIIHSNVSVLSCGLKAAWRVGVPHVTHVREYVDRDFGFRPYPSMKAYYHRLGMSHNYTIAITRGIQKHHRLSGSQACQIYNGIDTGIQPPGPQEQTAPYYLYAGRIEPAKGLMQLLEAYARFIQKYPQGHELRIAGEEQDAAYSARAHAFVAEHGLEHKVTFLGPCFPVAQMMRGACAVVVPSVFEAFGRVLPEAMLCDALTVGRDSGGTQEQLDNGLRLTGQEIGLRFRTTEELSLRLEEVFIAPARKYRQMKDGAMRTVRELYSKEQYINHVYALYRHILNLK